MRSREALKSQNEALEVTLDGYSLDKVLMETVEKQISNGSVASIQIVDPAGQRSVYGSAASVPHSLFRDAKGLKCGWSSSIFSSQENILGTFAIYNRNGLPPDAQDQQVLDLILHTAALAIERQFELQKRIFTE